MQNASTLEYVFLPPPKRQFLLATDVVTAAKIYDSVHRETLRRMNITRTLALTRAQFDRAFQLRLEDQSRIEARYNTMDDSASLDFLGNSLEIFRENLRKDLKKNFRILGILWTLCVVKEETGKSVKTFWIHFICKKITLEVNLKYIFEYRYQKLKSLRIFLRKSLDSLILTIL